MIEPFFKTLETNRKQNTTYFIVFFTKMEGKTLSTLFRVAKIPRQNNKGWLMTQISLVAEGHAVRGNLCSREQNFKN